MLVKVILVTMRARHCQPSLMDGADQPVIVMSNFFSWDIALMWLSKTLSAHFFCSVFQRGGTENAEHVLLHLLRSRLL